MQQLREVPPVGAEELQTGVYTDKRPCLIQLWTAFLLIRLARALTSTRLAPGHPSR